MASPGSVVIQFLVDAKKAAGDAAKMATSLGKVDDEAAGLDRTLDTLETELDSIGTASAGIARDMGKTETAFDSAADEADQAADRIRRSAQDMADGVHDGGTKIDNETDGIKGSMKEAGSEAGAEFIGNMAEGIGSGTANVQEVVQGTLGGLTNLAASLGGPVGLAAGVAAAGIGLVYAKLTAEAKAVEEQIGGIVGALGELRETSSETAKAQIWDAWVESLEDGQETIGYIASGLREAGVTQGEFQKAITGSKDAQLKVNAAVQTEIDKLLEKRREHVTLSKYDQRRLANLEEIQKQIGVGNEALEDTNSLIKDTELLTGDAAEEAKTWAEEQENVYNQTHKIKKELNDIPRSVPVNVVVTTKDKNGNPVRMPQDRSAPAPAPAGLTASTRAPTVTMTMAPQAAVIVTEEQVYRAVQRLILRGQARNGRVVLVG